MHDISPPSCTFGRHIEAIQTDFTDCQKLSHNLRTQGFSKQIPEISLNTSQDICSGLIQVIIHDILTNLMNIKHYL
jgi:hypothetical protein